MTGWRSVLDLDYLAELGAAVDALGESDAETETPNVQSRVLVDVMNDISNGEPQSPADSYYAARVGVDIERALRDPWRRGGVTVDRDRMKQQAYMRTWHGCRKTARKRRVAEIVANALARRHAR